MSSSEVSDCGRFSGQRTNFSNTCNRLSQYLKENGSFGDLSLGLSRNFVPSGNPRPTMDLLPMIEKSGQKSVQKPMNFFPTREEATKKMDTNTSVTKGVPEKAQMTIFYGGKVLVFNDFPADKAKEIMLLASNGSTTSVAPKLPESSALVPKVVPCFGNQRPPQQIASEMPIARKKSLARFFEKRKDRIVSNGPYPYQMNSPNAGSSSKAEERKAWLGLGGHFPVKIEH